MIVRLFLFFITDNQESSCHVSRSSLARVGQNTPDCWQTISIMPECSTNGKWS